MSMAQKVQVLLEDDLDGSEANDTVAFGLDGQPYEIDLNTAHAKELRAVFAPYVEAGRRVSVAGVRRRGRPASRPSRSSTPLTLVPRVPAVEVEAIVPVIPPGAKVNNADVREWARAQGRKVNDRGRLPAKLVDEWWAATH